MWIAPGRDCLHVRTERRSTNKLSGEILAAFNTQKERPPKNVAVYTFLAEENIHKSAAIYRFL